MTLVPEDMTVLVELSGEDVKDLEAAGVSDVTDFVHDVVAKGVTRRSAVRCRACAEWVGIREIDDKGRCPGCARWKVRRVIGFLNSGGRGGLLGNRAPLADRGETPRRGA